MKKTTITTTQSSIPLRPYTGLQLSILYQVNQRTFSKWIAPFKEEIGTRIGHYYSINQVKIIIEKIGFPGTLMAD